MLLSENKKNRAKKIQIFDIFLNDYKKLNALTSQKHQINIIFQIPRGFQRKRDYTLFLK
jgi:hypothetical protein